MTLPTVYVETTIPSIYHEMRTDPGSVARKNWTQHWWDFKRSDYEVFTSEAVLEELARGDYPTKECVLATVAELPILPIEPAVLEIVETYIRRSVMAADPVGDAVHLALASYYRMDFLLTWNCAHLANARKFHHIRVVNTMLGLFVPSLVTPLELLEEEA